MASSGKKGKKVKGKTVPLQEFIGDSPGVVPVRKYNNWSDEVDNEDVEYSRRDKVILPTAPRANRPDVDDDKIPQNPPFLSYLSNLPYEVNEDEIAEFFKDLDVLNVRLPRDDRQSGKLKGFGYVEFGTRESLISALNIPDKNIKQRHIRIEVADNSQDDRRRGGMRGEVKSRPRLNLQPRTKPVEKVAKIEPAQTQASIFGGAKPVDTAAKQREIEARLAAKEKELDVSWPSTRESGRTEDSRSKTTLETVNKLEAKKRKLLQQAEEEASALQTEIDLQKKRLRQMREDRSIRPLIIQSRSSALPGQAHESIRKNSVKCSYYNKIRDQIETPCKIRKKQPTPGVSVKKLNNFTKKNISVRSSTECITKLSFNVLYCDRSKSGSEYGDRDEDASEPKKLEPAPLPKGNAWNKPQGPRKELPEPLIKDNNLLDIIQKFEGKLLEIRIRKIVYSTHL
uniref:RRM domain-containing protein n=1 Tax=Timema poppense TaxID=170557 RepID=A0A7R9GTA6_TIMPO|nr:unnamed protein product [Timema poppensis]